VHEHIKGAGPSNCMDLFTPDAPWQQAARHVAVFKTSTQFATGATDAQLQQMLDALRQRHIGFAIEGPMIPRTRPCGEDVEGYSAPGTFSMIAERIHKLGGQIDYVGMDEPLYYGHVYNGPNACRSSIADIAQQLVANVTALRAVFPNVQIGDIEPVGSDDSGDWPGQIAEFGAAFQQATGRKLAFFQADIQWNQNYRPSLTAITRWARRNRITTGVIYNGTGRDATDITWVDDALAHARSIECSPALRPQQAILQSWMAHPASMLPETAPGTMTNFVLRYVAQSTPRGPRRSPSGTHRS
jgi:hypothetical protein